MIRFSHFKPCDEIISLSFNLKDPDFSLTLTSIKIKMHSVKKSVRRSMRKMRAGKQVSLLDRELNEFQVEVENFKLYKDFHFRNASMSFRQVSDGRSLSDLGTASRKVAVITSRIWSGN